jgi:hypothetical protein
VLGQRLRPAPHGCRRRATRPSRGATAATRRPAVDPAAIRTHLVLRGTVQRHRTAGDQPADRADGGRTAGRRPARRRARARGPAAARSRTARDRRAVERSPYTADLTRLRVCPAVQITDDRLVIMATPTRPRSHVTFPAGHPRTPTDYHPLGRDRTGYCWFPLCANRISNLKSPVRTGYFRYVPCHWR